MYEFVNAFAKSGMNVDVAPMPALSTKFNARRDAFNDRAFASADI
jgi:hypothetical protein